MNKQQLQVIDLLVQHEISFNTTSIDGDYEIVVPFETYCYSANMYIDEELDALFDNITKELSK